MEKAKRARKAETPKQTKPFPKVARAVPLSRPRADMDTRGRVVTDEYRQIPCPGAAQAPQRRQRQTRQGQSHAAQSETARMTGSSNGSEQRSNEIQPHGCFAIGRSESSSLVAFTKPCLA